MIDPNVQKLRRQKEVFQNGNGLQWGAYGNTVASPEWDCMGQLAHDFFFKIQCENLNEKCYISYGVHQRHSVHLAVFRDLILLKTTLDGNLFTLHVYPLTSNTIFEHDNSGLCLSVCLSVCMSLSLSLSLPLSLLVYYSQPLCQSYVQWPVTEKNNKVTTVDGLLHVKVRDLPRSRHTATGRHRCCVRWHMK